MRLSDRLETVVSMVRPAESAADIGTDHGHVPVELVRRGTVKRALAMDVRKGPLSRAEESVAMAGLENRIETRLSDGLEKLSPGEAEAVVIAGMGGETIIRILSQAPWTRSGETLLLLQPMTKQEPLRRWLNENGYAQCAERLVQDKDYLYPIFTVYGGPQPSLSVAEIYGGIDIEVDPLAGEYLTQRIRRLEQAEQGLAKSSGDENRQRARELGRIKQVLTERRAQL